jgi:probable rRNA maturation factor
MPEELRMIRENEEQVQVNFETSHAEGVDASDLQRAALAALASEGRPGARLTIALTDDEVVADLNSRYLGAEGATDVLSFSNQEPTPGFVSSAEMDDYLGDIIIALPFTRRQAEAQHHALREELRLLVVHGALHLLGYDHADEEEEGAMWARQEALLATLPE